MKSLDRKVALCADPTTITGITSAPISLLSIALLGLLVFLPGCGRGGDRSGAQPEPVRPVLYHEVAAVEGTRTRSFPARITAADLRELSFSVPGMVQSVRVRESEKVSAGQLLAELDVRDYESALAAVAARVENALQELERARRLLAEDAIARSVLEQREAVARVAQSEFEAAQKVLADARIVAPFDGVVSRVFIEVAQTVGPGTPAIRVFSRDDLEATIAVPASLVVNADGSRRESLGGLVRLDAERAVAIPAYFKKAEMEADASSQSFAATFGFKAPEGLMVLPGMNAEVELKLAGGNVPANAAQEQALALYVQTALVAFNEVETYLDQGVALARRASQIDLAASEAERALKIARLRHVEGEAPLLDVLTVQQRLAARSSEALNLQRLQLAQRANLHLALGGDW